MPPSALQYASSETMTVCNRRPRAASALQLLHIASLSDPPLRLLLGRDRTTSAEQGSAPLKIELVRKWKELSDSTGISASGDFSGPMTPLPAQCSATRHSPKACQVTAHRDAKRPTTRCGRPMDRSSRTAQHLPIRLVKSRFRKLGHSDTPYGDLSGFAGMRAALSAHTRGAPPKNFGIVSDTVGLANYRFSSGKV